MKRPFSAHLEQELKNIYNNPGSSIEELQDSTKKLADTLATVVAFLNDDLAKSILQDLENKHKMRS